MPDNETPQKFRKAPIFTPYVVVWSMFGMMSLGVLMVLGLAPEWLEDLKPAAAFSQPQSNQGQRASARLAADITALKQSVAQIQLELSQVKTNVASQSEQQKSVTAQLTSLETRIAAGPAAAASETTAAVAAPAAPLVLQATLGTGPAPQDQTVTPAAQVTTPAAEPAAAPVTLVPAPPSTPTVPPAASARTPKVINADTTSIGNPLETGSVATAKAAPASTEAISFGPAVVKPAPQPVGVKISSAATLESLRLDWSLLAEKHGDTLKALQARYVTAGDELNPSYDLVAGPVKSKAQATKVCKALAAKGVPCSIVGAFAGEPL